MKTTKERIRNCAFLLFQKYGYTKTTTRMIAKSAGVSESTIFNNYGNKANLFHEIYYTQPSSPNELPVEGLSCGKDLRNDLYLLIHEQMKLTIEDVPMYSFSLPLIDVVEEDLHSRNFENVKHTIEVFTAYFNLLEVLGKIRHLDYEALTSLLISVFLIKSFTLVTKMPDEEYPHVSYDEEALEEFTDRYVDWLLEILSTEKGDD